MLNTENNLIAKYNTNNQYYGYNLRISAESNFGIVHSANAKTRIKGRKLSTETKNKMSKSRQGIKHHSAKLNVEQVKLIKVLISKGFRNINIARYLNISKSMVNDIKNNGKWDSVVINEDDLNSFQIQDLNIDNQTRLNNNQVLTIKFLLRNNIPNYLIAEYCKITQRNVTEIKTGKTYNQVKLDEDSINEMVNSFNFKCLAVLKSEYLIEKKKKNKQKALKGSHNPASKLNEDDVLKIKGLINNHVDIKEIATSFNVSVDCISKIKSGDNWSHLTKFQKTRTGKLKGSHHPNYKHSDDTVLSIVELTKQGLKTKEICNILNLEKTFINRVKSGKIRSNITGIKPGANLCIT